MFLRTFRFIAVCLWAILVFGIGFLFCLLRPFNPTNNYWVGHFLGMPGLKIMGIKFEVEGKEIVNNTQPAIIIANHTNNLDMFPGAIMCPKRIVLMGKTSIKYIPFFGQFFWLAGNILLARNVRTKAIEQLNALSKKIVDNKLTVWIFAEGTRSWGKGLGPFKKGAFVTAIDAQVPIIIVCFNNYALDVDLGRLNAGTIRTKVLEPIPTIGLTRDDVPALLEKCHKLMSAEVERLTETNHSLNS